MRTALVNRLGTDVPVRFGDLSWMAWADLQDEFLDEASAVFLRFRLEPSGHDGVLALEGALLHRVMGLMLGESPNGEGGGAWQKRAPTRMDLSVARRLGLDILGALAEALPGAPRGGWQLHDRTAPRETPVDPSRPRLVLLEVSGASRVDLEVARTALMMDATLDFGPAEDPYGLMTLALPAAFAADLWPETVVEKPAGQDGLARVLPLPVTAIVELARVRLSLGELQGLRVGDRISLGAARAVTVTVAGRPAASAEAGDVDGIRCVRVLDRLT
jgi:flagellar motor switch/type III secretory pathway protein FliN